MDKPRAVVSLALRRLFVVAAVFVAMMSVGPGARAFYDGEKLYNYCRTAGPELLYCQAYVSAIADALGGGNSIYGFRACMGMSVTLGKAMDVTLQFLNGHPEIRHHEAAWLVAQAFAQSFPCQK